MSTETTRAATAASGEMTITEGAKSELLKLTEREGAFLRVWVEQGGCSGMMYKAVIDDTSGPFDIQVYDDGDLRVVTDQQSRMHVEGIHVDYSNDLVKAGFRFLNPRASASCGCGQSFRE